MSYLETTAKRIPEGIRKLIVEKKMIDNATESFVNDSPMEYLFDVHAEFLDPTGEFQNFDCPKCRHHVLENFRKLKPYL